MACTRSRLAEKYKQIAMIDSERAPRALKAERRSWEKDGAARNT